MLKRIASGIILTLLLTSILTLTFDQFKHKEKNYYSSMILMMA